MRGGRGMINKEAIIYTSLVKFVEHIAREKAGHNCWGLLYEPKRPEALKKRTIRHQRKWIWRYKRYEVKKNNGNGCMFINGNNGNGNIGVRSNEL